MCAEHQGDHSPTRGQGGEDADQEEQRALVERARPGLFARGGVAMVRWYQRYLSPLKPPVCRFHPSCSQYTLEAIERYGDILNIAATGAIAKKGRMDEGRVVFDGMAWT